MLLPLSEQTKSSDDDEEPDPETDDAVREATLLLLRIMYAQAQNRMENMEQERELLKNAPPPPPPGISPEVDVRRTQRGGAEEYLWRLDTPSLVDRGPDGKGPLLDTGGKVRTEVFISSHIQHNLSLSGHLPFFLPQL